MAAVVMAVMMCASGAKAGVPADTLAYRMDLQRYLFPQEKVHVTTDQGRYVAGDTVWMRAFVVDAASHRPLTLSRYVYVEIQSPFGQVETRIKLRHDSAGVFAGYLPLREDLAEGDYTMHAYTAFMENQGPQYFFRKRLPVMSPLSGRATVVATMEPGTETLQVHVADRSDPSTPVYFKEMVLTTATGREVLRGPARKAERVRLRPEEIRAGVVRVRVDNYSRYIGLPSPRQDSLTVGFYPEGGYLVPGEANRVGVKATDSAGRGVDVSGSVISLSDSSQVAVFSTIHRGMGTLTLVPQQDVAYAAVVEGRTYPLPQADASAAVVRADAIGGGDITVTTAGTVPGGSTLLAHSRGRLIWAGDAPQPGVPVRFPRASLEGGVVSVMLLDPHGRTLSERLVFAGSDSAAVVRPQVSVTEDSGRRRLRIGLPEGADCAVAVLDGALAEADTVTTIASTLLLQGDLRGHIEDAGWYLRGVRTRRRDAAADALMLTQGWRRYDVPSVLLGRTADPQLPLEQCTEISGQVRSLWRNRPIEGAQVNLLAPTLNLARVVTTGSDGRFSVSDVDFPEGTRLVLQSLNKKGGYEQNFTIDTVAYPALRHLPQAVQTLRPGDPAATVLAATRDYTTRMHYADGRYEVRLSDVTVQGYRPQDIQDIYQTLARYSIDISKLEKEESITSYEEVIRKFPGIMYDYDRGTIKYRGEPIDIWINGMTKFEPTLTENGTLLGIPHTVNIGMAVSKNGKEALQQRLATTFNTKTFLLDKNDFILNLLSEAYPVNMIKSIDLIPSGMSLIFGSLRPVLHLTTKGPADMIADRPYQLKLVSPLGFQTPKEFYHQDYDSNESPDLSSTLYWIPCASESLELTISNDVTTKVVIEGVNNNGTIILH